MTGARTNPFFASPEMNPSLRTAWSAAAVGCALLCVAAPARAASHAHAHAPAAPSHGESTPLDLGTTPVHTASTGGGGGLMRTLLGLAVVVGLIYGLAWLMRRLKGAREERQRGTGLASIATVPLGPNRAVHLIRAGREYALVGVAEHGVQPIRTYSEDEARSLGLLDDPPEDPPVAGLPGGTPAFVATFLDQLRSRTVRR
jgi:flagellar protein FliO/FliZ